MRAFWRRFVVLLRMGAPSRLTPAPPRVDGAAVGARGRLPVDADPGGGARRAGAGGRAELDARHRAVRPDRSPAAGRAALRLALLAQRRGGERGARRLPA